LLKFLVYYQLVPNDAKQFPHTNLRVAKIRHSN
jgi:hypothetical protein